MLLEVEGNEVEVVGRVERRAGRQRTIAARGRVFGSAIVSRPRVIVHLDEVPGPELLALSGDYPEACVEGVARTSVRIRVQRSPAVLMVEWDD